MLDYELLCLIKTYFGGIGSITCYQAVCVYSVVGLDSINVIITHFNKYPLQSNKFVYFLLLCEVIKFSDSHLMKFIHTKSTEPSLIDYLKVKYSDYPALIEKYFDNRKDLDSNWILGFLQSNAKFINKVTVNEFGVKTLQHKFLMSSINYSDLMLFNFIAEHIGCTDYINRVSNTIYHEMSIENLETLNNVVIPFFQTHQIYGSLYLDFQVFSNDVFIANLVNKRVLLESDLAKCNNILNSRKK